MNDPKQSRMPASGSEDSDLFDYPLIADYVGFVLRSATRHKLRFALCFLAVLGAAAVLLAILPRKYQVQAILLAQRNPIMGTLSNPTLNRDGDVPARAAREVVMRRENLVDLLRQTDFVERHMATRAPISRARDWILETITGRPESPESRLDAFADGLVSKLWVMVGTEGTVTINFTWSNPDLAFQTVEAAVQSYLEARHTAEISAIGETIAVLESHDASVRKEAAALAKQLSEKERDFRRATARPSAGARARQQISADEELPRLEATLAARRRALLDLEEFRRRRLDDLQAQLTQQTNVYAPQHPVLMATKKGIEGLSGSSPQVEQLRAEVRDLEVEVKRRGGTASASSLPVGLADLDDSRFRLEDSDPVLDYERSQFRALLRKHANLLERIDVARVEMDTMQAAFKYRYSVISPPQYPKKPSQPLALILLGGGIVGGLAFGFFATTIADIRGGKVVERWQVERQLRLPVLAEIHRED